jgi:hypothetical protein
VIDDINFKRLEPVSTHATLAFVSWRDDASPYGVASDIHTVDFPYWSDADEARGESLRAVRRHHGATLMDVSRATGLSPADVGLIERGGATVDVVIYCRIVASLGPWRELPPRRLLPGRL